jgi:hypothetical protein
MNACYKQWELEAVMFSWKHPFVVNWQEGGKLEITIEGQKQGL